MRRSLLILLVLPLIAFVALSARGVHARGTLDQNFTPAADVFDDIMSGEPAVIGQTFTAGISGQLDTVALDLFATLPGSTISVSIFPANAGGLPISTAALATSTTGIAGLASCPAGPAQFTFVSFAAPATVVAGQQYTIVISNVSTPILPIINIVNWCFDGGSTYPPGQGVSGDSIGGPYTDVGDGISFDFQTYVTPPATASATPSPTPASGLPASNGLNITIVYALTVTTTGCGTTTPGGQILTNGLQSVVVTAVPCPGSRFTGWTGGPCNGTTINPCDFPPLATPVTANFSP